MGEGAEVEEGEGEEEEEGGAGGEESGVSRVMEESQ